MVNQYTMIHLNRTNRILHFILRKRYGNFFSQTNYKIADFLQIPEWKVLIIEAGIEENFVMDIPILANLLQFSEANWKYKTVPSNDYCLGKLVHICSYQHLHISLTESTSTEYTGSQYSENREVHVRLAHSWTLHEYTNHF